MRVKNATVVITGASSGIGRATAHAFARKGAAVVLAARREEALNEVVEECESLGGQALAVPTDVADEAAVEALARRAVDHFGGIDIWVNAAAVGLYAPFEEVPLEDFRKVLDTNVMGYVYGARAALPYLRGRRHGVLINVSSVASLAAQPYASAYAMSKAAVTAMSASLRQELRLSGHRSVKVCTVLPAAIDTPFFRHAGNYTGRRVVAMPPVYSPERVAKTIVRLSARPRDEVIVGPAGRGMRAQARLTPRAFERAAAAQFDRTHLSREEDALATPGTLHTPPADSGSVHGGWHGKRRTAARRLALAGAAGAAAAGVAGLRAQRSHS